MREVQVALNLVLAAKPMWTLAARVAKDRITSGVLESVSDALRELVGAPSLSSLDSMLARLHGIADRATAAVGGEAAEANVRVARAVPVVLLGLVEKKRGNLAAALQTFKRAEDILDADIRGPTPFARQFRAVYGATFLDDSRPLDALRVLRLGDPAEGLGVLDGYGNPAGESPLVARAGILFDMGRTDEALRTAVRAWAPNPGNLDALTILTTIRESRGELAEAVQECERAWLLSGNPRIGTLLARLSLQLGEVDRALSVADTVMAKDSAMDEVVRVRARALYALKRPKEALDTLRSAPSTASSIDSMLLQATVERELNDYPAARSTLERASSFAKEDVSARYAMAEFLCEVGRYEEAHSELARIVVASTSAWVWSLWARTLYYTGAALEVVHETCSRASQLASEEDAVWYEKETADVLRAMGQEDAARAKYNKVLELAAMREPRDQHLWLLGWCHLWVGDFSEAIGHLTAASSVHPEPTPVDFDLGLALLLARQDELGMKQYGTAREHAEALHPERRRGVKLVAYCDLIDARRSRPWLQRSAVVKTILDALEIESRELGAVLPVWAQPGGTKVAAQPDSVVTSA